MWLSPMAREICDQMIITPTVFILGAGASAPYGLPLGAELVNKIVDELKPGPTDNKKALDCLTQAAGGGPELSQLEAFRKTLEDSRERSIDSFLQYHSEFTNQGKRAIAWVLMNAEENNPSLHPDRKKTDHDWYPLLRDMLSAPFAEFQNNKAAFLTFNYDRSLEHFLLMTLRSRQSGQTGNDAWAAKLRESIPIIHLHGELGVYRPFLGDRMQDALDYGTGYGEEVTPRSIRVACKRIRNVHDKCDLDSDPAFQNAYKLISRAELIFFLGFRYDMRNVRKLQLEKYLNKPENVYGTGLDLTDAECADMQIKSNSMILKKNILRYDCSKFLRECFQARTIFEQM